MVQWLSAWFVIQDVRDLSISLNTLISYTNVLVESCNKFSCQTEIYLILLKVVSNDNQLMFKPMNYK